MARVFAPTRIDNSPQWRGELKILIYQPFPYFLLHIEEAMR